MALPSLSKTILPESDQHKMIVREIRDRYTISHQAMVKHHPKWNRVDKESAIYANTDELARKDCERPDNDLELKVGFSWAMQQTALMYYTSVFLGRSPIFQFEGVHGEGQDKIQGMEALVNYQLRTGEMVPPLYGWLDDTLNYGVGIVGEYWSEEVVRVARYVKKPVMAMGAEVPGKTELKYEEAAVEGYQGNKLFNVRPYNFFPDPAFTLRDFQKGEFVGRTLTMSYNEMLERQEAGEYFNVDKVGRAKGTPSTYGDSEAGNTGEDLAEPDQNITVYGGSKTAKDSYPVLEMVVNILPAKWKLGTGELPQKWVFTLADDSVLIGCRPLGLLHNRYPFHITEYEIDAHNFIPRGMTEILAPMNDILSWFVNSHVYNVRKALNNELIYDPSRIATANFRRKGPGRLIKLLPAAYGTDPKAAIHQLALNDVTRGHLNDIRQFKDLMQMITGVNDALMGAMNSGGRKTAAEVRTSSTMGINRLKMGAEYGSATGWASLSKNLIASTQQLYNQEKAFKIAGNMIDPQNQYVQVDPELISGFFEYIPVDGTLPVDRAMQSNLFKELLLGTSRMAPQILQQYDIGKILEHILKLEGVKNLDSFKFQVVPDGELARQARSGQVVPIAQRTGGSMGANPSEVNQGVVNGQ